MSDKAGELIGELRAVLGGRGNLLDTALPPVVFVAVNALLGLTYATPAALIVAVAIAVLRVIRGQRLTYALVGIGGVLLALGLAVLLGKAQGFFLPDLVTGGLIVLAALISVLVRRPLVALTSFVARRWPLTWYWHPRVRPAYSEVTLAWSLFFALRLALQYVVYTRGSAFWVAAVNILGGWPATIVLLVLSYLYGTWRLRRLGGPSVEEFKRHASPPWRGQRRGF